MSYDLWYWTGIPGRGEFVRLPLEAAGIAYRDRAREEGDEALVADLKARGADAPFAPPYLVADGRAIGQVANILHWLGERHPIAPEDPEERRRLHQFQLTVTDFLSEVHNVHHPVSGGLYYHEQQAEAARAAPPFRESRLPKYLGWFERSARGPWLAGERWSYGDTSVFQLVEGLRYMFPRRMTAIGGDYPKLGAIRDRVAALPGIAAYLASERRLAFNTGGIFRYYPELDAA